MFSHVPIITAEREVRLAGWIQLCEQRLVNGNMTASKSVRRAGNVKTPYAIGRFIDKAERFIMTGFQSAKPVTQRERIMFAQIFDIADFEAGRFRRGEHEG